MRLVLRMGVAALCLSVCPSVLADELQNPPDMRKNGDGPYVLIAKTEIYPFNGTQVQTRSFVTEGADKSPKRLIAPTLRAHPGEHVRLKLRNDLTPTTAIDIPGKKQAADRKAEEKEAGDFYPEAPKLGHGPGSGTYVDTLPHGFDILNLHTHGLHVSPLGNSDNVLLNILPKGATADDLKKACHMETDKDVAHRHVCVDGEFDFEYKIPDAHPSGTYWYHPHKHGSVAIQLGSGMAGALIIEDEKRGIDSLPAVKHAKAYDGERILVIQEINYSAAFSPDGAPSKAPNAVNCYGTYGVTVCNTLGYDYPTGYAPPINGQFSVNGQVNPTISMAPGEAMLWRVINTTVGNVQPFCVVPASGTTTPAPALYALAADGVPVQRPLKAGATDQPFLLGPPVYDLTTATAGTDVITNELVLMAPGQRMDLMVQAPTAEGQYVIYQAPAPATGANAQNPTTSLCGATPPSGTPTLLTINVTKKRKAKNLNKAVPTQTALNALYTPIDLTTANDVPDGPTQGVVFGFTNTEYAPPAIGGASVVNGRPFNLERVQRRLKLGQMDRWGVQSASDTHMFHIHINSFQIVQRGAIAYDFPVWRDTALINCAPGPGGCTFPFGNTAQPNDNPPGGSGEVLQFLSRALDFHGPMVMHCHNVNHEDNGMMELLELVR
ncbi:multicopper oxidase family protein [Niveispirillum sp. KHB5.9]|uniref:multicopper oxidase family protein n=1 Tax=Niveispirillum sp. KHB5.9 TaxID=3400269 RepID=UPI003A8B09A2